MKTPATTSTSMNDNAKGPGGRATKSFLQHHAPLFVSPPPSLNSEAFVTTPTPVSDVTKGAKQQALHAPQLSVAPRLLDSMRSPTLSSTAAAAVSTKKRSAKVITPIPGSSMAAAAKQAKRSRLESPQSRNKLTMTQPFPKALVPSTAASKKKSTAAATAAKSKRKNSNVDRNFFEDIHHMVSDSTAKRSSLIHWSADGASFVFEDDNIGAILVWICKYFPHCRKYASFRRRLGLYGWKRLNLSGCKKPKGETQKSKMYHHPLFCRDMDAAGLARAKQHHVEAMKEKRPKPKEAAPASRKIAVILAAAPPRKAAVIVGATENTLKIKMFGTAQTKAPPKPASTGSTETASDVQLHDHAKTPSKLTKTIVAVNEGLNISTPLALKQSMVLPSKHKGVKALGAMTMGKTVQTVNKSTSRTAVYSAANHVYSTPYSVRPPAFPPLSRPLSSLMQTTFDLEQQAGFPMFNFPITPLKSSKTKGGIGAQSLLVSADPVPVKASLKELYKVTFHGGASTPATSPLVAAALSSASDLNQLTPHVERLLAAQAARSLVEPIMESPKTPSTKTVTKPDPSPPSKWSVGGLVFSPIRLSPYDSGILSKSSVSFLELSSVEFAASLSPWAGLSDEELFVNSFEAV